MPIVKGIYLMPQPQQHCALQQAILVALLQSNPQRPQSMWVGVAGGLGGPPPPCTVILNANLSSPPDLCNRPKVYMRGIRGISGTVEQTEANL